MIDIIYRKPIADLLKIEVHQYFGDDFEVAVRDIVTCYNLKNLVVLVYLDSRGWRTRKSGSGACFYFGGITKPGVREIWLGLHNRHQMLLTLFHELEHLMRPRMICFSSERRQREESLVEKRAKSAYHQYERLLELRRQNDGRRS